MSSTSEADSRQVGERLAHIRRRIDAAARRSGRTAESITLVGASKRQSPERLRAAWDAGLRIFGENRVQEAEAHAEILPDATWHLIGPLQSNKVQRAATLFDVVHSVDRWKIARLLAEQAAEQGRRLPCFLEVDLGCEDSKHGFPVDGLAERVAPIADLAHLEVRGLMAIPPFEDDPEASRPWFVRLRRLAEELAGRPEWSGFPAELSMGMSNDFEVAIEEGATHVRVGSALFGPRST
jgi:pyridoxal phosphate enzyme (YggS family)